MSPQQTPSASEDRTNAPEYTGGHAQRQHDRAGHVSSRGLRLTYFSIASVWGFVIGVAGLAVTVQRQGHAVWTGAEELLFLVLALAVAVGGAFVVAGAYQEAKLRRR